MKKDNLKNNLWHKDGLAFRCAGALVRWCSIPNRVRDKGFTMAEILIALTILTIGLISILSLFPVGLKASKRAGDLNEAALCAQEILEGLKLCVYDDVDPSTTSITDIPGVNTNIYAKYLDNSEYVVTNLTANLKQIDLTVRWVDAGRTNEEEFITYRANYE